ncbi:hypothetical protein K502DRAFT_159142 [Neoconidiobolus thromboides FSU 785]|nr:hypothetical protein K502DRAFT_159142 [Neoconidiobolus thromboides FSU 785]
MLKKQREGALEEEFDLQNVYKTINQYNNKITKLVDNPITFYAINRKLINSITKEPSTSYALFLQTAVDIYINYIDGYHMWLTPSQLLNLINKKQTNSTAYSIFLSFVSLSLFDSNSAVRYFQLAVRMCICLGYDKKMDSTELQFINEEEKETKLQGHQLWKSIGLSWMFLAIFNPSFSNLDIDFNNIKEKESKSTSDTIKYKLSLTNSNLIQDKNLIIENQLIEALVEIMLQIQMIKSKYKNEEYKLIKNEELQLPNDKFNNILTTFISLGFYKSIYIGPIVNNKNNEINKMKANIEYNQQLLTFQLDIFCQLITIYLYYPIVLIHPKPIKFNLNEFNLLYRSTHIIAEYYFQLNTNKTTNHQPNFNLDNKYNNLIYNQSFNLIYHAPYYSIISYCCFVYYCFIGEMECYLKIGVMKNRIEKCKVKCLKLLLILKNGMNSKIKNERVDAKNNIGFIKMYVDNFKLEGEFLRQVRTILD